MQKGSDYTKMQQFKYRKLRGKIIEKYGSLGEFSNALQQSFVTISNTVKRTSDKDYENFKENLYLSTETYIETNKVEINSEEVISIQTLISEGFIKDNIKNPKTDKSIINDSIKVTPNIDQNGNVEYSYSYIENGE